MEEQRAREEQGKLLAAAEDHNAEFDLLSRLSEHLIHRVLSRLPLQDIVKAHAVCKLWRHIFSSFPVLDFRCDAFVRKRKGPDIPQDVIRSRAEGMLRFVDATMTRFQEQHLKIDKFAMDYCCGWFKDNWTDDCLSQLEKWTAIALDNHAKEISIVLPFWSFSEWMDTVPELPSLDLVPLSGSTNGLKSLRSLTLDGFIGGEFLSWGRLTSACGSLESLSLSCCGLNAVRISGLLNLKTVSIEGCRDLKEVRIYGLPNLKTVSITVCRRSTRLVEIEAPGLESFIYSYELCELRTHPCGVNVNHSPNLKSLTLRNLSENDEWFRDFLSRFQRLRDLSISFCDSLTKMRISNPSIESIDIQSCTHLTNISIATPELRRFLLWPENGLLPSIRMESPPRRNPVAEVDVYLPPAPAGWSSKVREFLVGSCKSFTVQSFIGRQRHSGRVFQLRNDIKNRWLGVIACNTKQLDSLARRHATQEALPGEVDGTDVSGLIWTPHPDTVTVVAGLSEDDFLQLFCDKVTECGCCSRELSPDCRSYNDIADIKIVPWSNN